MEKQPHIISGKYKGQKLLVPNSARPLTGRIKQSLFDTLNNYIQDSRVLDCFAGSGSFGLEALSRGAEHITFVEQDSQAITLLEKNIQKVGCVNKTNVRQQSVASFLKHNREQFEIVFTDPPFKDAGQTFILDYKKSLAIGGLLVVRTPLEVDLGTKNRLNLKTLPLLLKEQLGVSIIWYFNKVGEG